MDGYDRYLETRGRRESDCCITFLLGRFHDVVGMVCCSAQLPRESAGNPFRLDWYVLAAPTYMASSRQSKARELRWSHNVGKSSKCLHADQYSLLLRFCPPSPLPSFCTLSRVDVTKCGIFLCRHNAPPTPPHSHLNKMRQNRSAPNPDPWAMKRGKPATHDPSRPIVLSIVPTRSAKGSGTVAPGKKSKSRPYFLLTPRKKKNAVSRCVVGSFVTVCCRPCQDISKFWRKEKSNACPSRKRLRKS